MIRWPCSWFLLCGVLGVLGCGSETPIPNSAGGSSNASGSGGAIAGNSSSGAGAGGAITAGSASQPASGGAAGSGAGTAGASSGGMGGMGGSAGAGGTPNVPTLPKRVLLYHFSTLVIGSVPAQLSLLESQLESWDFEVVVSDDPADLTAANLATFGGVGMINTCFEPFGAGQSGEAEATALKTFVENGGGLFGTHCATVTFQSANPPHPYNQLIGGRGGDGNSEATSACRKTAEQHVATDMLPANFNYTGNLDNADYVAPDTKVLVMCKWSDNGMKDTAVSWYRTPGQGRVFYTNFAKEDVDLDEATIGQKHILLGLRWTLRL